MYSGRRVLMLYLVAVLGMGVLGIAAMLVTELRYGVWADLLPDEGFFFVLVPFCIGCFFGAFSAPVVRFGLARSDLRFALPIVYGVSLVVVISIALTSQLYLFGLECAVPAFFSVCVLSALGQFIFPLARVAMAGMCSVCGYDLRGNTSGVCPECGGAIQGRRRK